MDIFLNGTNSSSFKTAFNLKYIWLVLMNIKPHYCNVSALVEKQKKNLVTY